MKSNSGGQTPPSSFKKPKRAAKKATASNAVGESAQTSIKTRTVTCPQCKKAAVYSAENPFRPFCSERCRLIDLGAWAANEYKVPSKEPITEADIEDSSED